MDRNDVMYTKEKDGTIAKWFVVCWVGNRFAVSTQKNAKLHNYHRYFDINDIGKIIFFQKDEAKKIKE